MKVRLLALNVEKNIPFARFQARIVSSIKNYAEGNETFEHYEKMRDLFGGFQDALQKDELIVIAVGEKHYFKLKKAISQAFEVESVQSPAVLNMLENNASLSDEQRENFASFPEPATVFLSKDGMYSGFGIDNGEKFIIVIPIDNDRINMILRNGVVPYLAKGIGTESGLASEVQHFDNEKVETAILRLWESGSVVAINGTANAEVLKNLGESVEHFNDVTVFTPHVEDKGEVNVTEYAAQLARVSLDLSAANIGASISDIYETEGSKYICIAVADDENATVRKLYLEDGETEDAFIESVAAELFDLIGERAAGIRSIGIEVADAPAEAPAPIEKKSSKKTVAVLAIIMGVVIVLCAVLAIVFKMQGEKGALAGVFRKVFGYETTTESTTAPTTNPPETTNPSESNENKLKISDFIIADIIELEKKRQEESENPTESQKNPEPSTNENGETVPSASETQEDKGAPEFITVNGEKMPAKEALAGLVMSEMGDGYDIEAIKAQTVVIYTYLKYRDNGFVIDGVQISKTVAQEVETAVGEVFGRYLSYNGEVALTPFFETAAGGTADASLVFGGNYPYLRAIARLDGNPEAQSEGYENSVQLKRGEIQGILLNAGFEIDVNDDPAKWIIIRERNTAVSSSVGYVKSIRVGGQDLTGYEFITKLSSLGIKSSCFKLSYDSSTETFTFTSYGTGCGVGMSKTGANALAGKGYNYERILRTYFSATTLSKEANV